MTRTDEAMTLEAELIAELLKQADEIAAAGINGWGNTMRSAAEALQAARADREASQPAAMEPAVCPVCGAPCRKAGHRSFEYECGGVLAPPAVDAKVVRDAARYRFIRDEMTGGEIETMGHTTSPDNMDAWVDAAFAARQPGEPS